MEHLDIIAVILSSAIVVVAYAIFGLTGFGSSVTAMPFLVQMFPLRVVVPIMSLLDLVCGLLVWGRNRGEFIRREVVWMIPPMLIGMGLGVTMLVNAPERLLLFTLGISVLSYSAWKFFAKTVTTTISPWWSIPFSMIGGVFSALFGTGGPIYTIYLTRRIEDPSKLRTNISIVIMLSGLARLVLFSGFGLYSDVSVQFLLVALLPYGVVGLFLGLRLNRTIKPERVVQLIYAVLIVGGISLLVRAAMME